MPNNYIDINGAQTLYNDLRGRAARAGGNLAAEYSTSATYSVGDYVIYKDKLYRCKTAVTTAGSWASNSSKFEQTNFLNDSASEETGLDLLALEQRKTEALGIVLYEIDTLIQNLPSDEMGLEIRDKLADTNGWLDMIYNEMVLREAV